MFEFLHKKKHDEYSPTVCAVRDDARFAAEQKKKVERDELKRKAKLALFKGVLVAAKAVEKGKEISKKSVKALDRVTDSFGDNEAPRRKRKAKRSQVKRKPVVKRVRAVRKPVAKRAKPKTVVRRKPRKAIRKVSRKN